MKKNLNLIGIIILLVLFLLFYVITTFLLDKRNLNETKVDTPEPVEKEKVNVQGEAIINNLYNEVRIMYDVVNNKFKVDQEDTITIGDIIYKKITNFDEVMNPLFTEKGRDKYITDLGNYFAHSDNGYYLAGNLVSYQTYYFRGDETNIYVTDSSESEINGIIYEKWKSNNKNTLATIKVINNEGTWLIDNIDILATE